MQIGLTRHDIGAKTRPVDLEVLHHPLDVVARLGQRYALDSIHRVNLGIARIAVLRRTPG